VLRKFRYSHGGKSFEVDAVELETGQTVSIQVFVFLAVQDDQGLYPYGFRFLDERQGKRIHYTPEEFYKIYDIPADVREEIRHQRQSM
jgi:hypothetical protein